MTTVPGALYLPLFLVLSLFVAAPLPAPAQDAHGEESAAEILARAQDSIVLDGVTLTLSAYLWENHMPGTGGRSGLMCNVGIDATGRHENAALPGIQSGPLWLVRNNRVVWRTRFVNEMDPSKSNYGGMCRGGPMGLVGGLTAVVRITHQGKTFHLKKAGLAVNMVH